MVLIDPARLARTQENMEISRRRMQESVNAKAAEHAEKMKEVSVWYSSHHHYSEN
jgi:hypothetical protein